MLTILLVGLVGMLTNVVVFVLTGYLPTMWQWWAIMVPASWVFTAVYHLVDWRTS